MANNRQLLANLVDIKFIAENWLHHFQKDTHYGHIGNPSRIYVDKLERALTNNDPQVGLIYKELREKIRVNCSDLEVADADVVCAIIDYKQGQLNQAKSRLESTLAVYRMHSLDHYQAVLNWMLGIINVYTYIPANQMDAVYQWERCRTLFEWLVDQNPERTNRDQNIWYRDRITEIEQFISVYNAWVTENNLGTAPSFVRPGTGPQPTAQSGTRPTTQTSPSTSSSVGPTPVPPTTS
jgi:hypothetical protein